jgi:hypothetical protein
MKAPPTAMIMRPSMSVENMTMNPMKSTIAPIAINAVCLLVAELGPPGSAAATRDALTPDDLLEY